MNFQGNMLWKHNKINSYKMKVQEFLDYYKI